MWSQQNRGDFTPKTHGLVRISHKEKVLCEFHTRGRCCANFAQAWAVVRNSHMLGLLCEIRTCLEQLSSKGHLFLISAPNRTRLEGLDSWLLELRWYIARWKWTSKSAPKVRRKTATTVLCSLHFVFLFASLLYLACLNNPKSCQNTKTSHKYD